MVDENKGAKCEDPECVCGCNEGGECDCVEEELEIYELEDENGDVAEFVILDELDFENRHFVIMAPLSEVEAMEDAEDDEAEIDLSIEIFEADGDSLSILEDEQLAIRLMQHLDKISQELDED